MFLDAGEAALTKRRHAFPHGHAVDGQVIEQQGLCVLPPMLGEQDPLHEHTRVLCTELHLDPRDPVLTQKEWGRAISCRVTSEPRGREQ